MPSACRNSTYASSHLRYRLLSSSLIRTSRAASRWTRQDCEERLEGPGLGGGLPALVGLAGLDQDVEIPHAAQVGRHELEAAPVAVGAIEVEGVTEDPPRRPLAAGGDAHPVQLLRVLADAGAGLAGDHPGQVEAEDLAAGLGQVVVREDAGRLGDDDPRRLRDGLGAPPRARRRRGSAASAASARRSGPSLGQPVSASRGDASMTGIPAASPSASSISSSSGSSPSPALGLARARPPWRARAWTSRPAPAPRSRPAGPRAAPGPPRRPRAAPPRAPRTARSRGRPSRPPRRPRTAPRRCRPRP